MLAIEERRAWTKAYQQGEPCKSWILEDYKKNHNDSTWRASRSAEELCAYILVLENDLDECLSVLGELPVDCNEDLLI